MFAGPNGSGKSTLKTVLDPKLLGVYLNPDEMEREMRATGLLDVNHYGVSTTGEEATAFFRESKFLRNAGPHNASERVRFDQGHLIFSDVAVDSYVASVTADFLRQKLLAAKKSLTIETVMSHRGKVELLQTAQDLGYRTYLYFIATEDPAINVSRVANRVRQGGHPVPEDKIVKRYYASLNLLIDAIRRTNRAYLFDNSGHEQDRRWIAEVTNGSLLEMKSDLMPAWFKNAVWDKINPRTA